MSCDQLPAFIARQLDESGRRAFLEHLSTCAACRESVERHARVDDSLRAWAAAPEAPFSSARLVAKAKTARTIRRGAFVAIAAAAVIVIGVVTNQSAPRVLETPGAVAVGDDVVTLDDASTAEVVETKTETRVALKTGRATFEVAKRAKGKRFVVTANDLEVRVVGTKFSVHTGATSSVDVEHGVVEVWTGGVQRTTLRDGERWPSPVPVPVVIDAGVLELDAGIAVVVAPTSPRAAPFDLDAVVSLFANGKLDEASAKLTVHLKEAPGDAKAWAVLGDLRRKEDRPLEAVVAYEKAARSSDAELRSRSRLLAASLAQDRLADQHRARRLLEPLVNDSHCPSTLMAPALLRLARVELSQNRRSEAKALLERVLARHGDSPSAVEARELLRSLD